MYKFKFELFPRPEIDYDLVTTIVISLVNNSGESIQIIVAGFGLETNDFQRFQEWCEDNENAIRTETFPMLLGNILPTSSLAEKERAFFIYWDENYPDDDEIDDEIDALLDKLSDYRQGHYLNISLSGLDNIHKVYIGLNNGHYEVSRLDDGVNYQYKVDIDSFFEEVKKIEAEYSRIIKG